MQWPNWRCTIRDKGFCCTYSHIMNLRIWPETLDASQIIEVSALFFLILDLGEKPFSLCFVVVCDGVSGTSCRAPTYRGKLEMKSWQMVASCATKFISFPRFWSWPMISYMVGSMKISNSFSSFAKYKFCLEFQQWAYCFNFYVNVYSIVAHITPTYPGVMQPFPSSSLRIPAYRCWCRVTSHLLNRTSIPWARLVWVSQGLLGVDGYCEGCKGFLGG